MCKIYAIICCFCKNFLWGGGTCGSFFLARFINISLLVFDYGGNEKIRNFVNKSISVFVVILLLASTFALLTVSTPSNAQDSMTAKTQIFLSVRPILL